MGNAGLALISSFFALGALFGEAGFSAFQAMLFTVFVYALPGQLVAAELVANGAGLIVIAIAVWFVNARLLPLTTVLLVLVSVSDKKNLLWKNLLTSHLIAVTSWVIFLGTYQDIPENARRRYFITLSGVLWGFGSIATVLGHWVGGQLPVTLLVALLFLNPAYFLCVMLTALNKRSDTVAFALGAALMPIVHIYSPQWDIVVAGILGGSIVFYFFER